MNATASRATASTVWGLLMEWVATGADHAV
jgi:hypothetical protein